MNLAFFIARRNLLKQKGNFSSFIIRIAILATTLSVAVMIVALSIVGGFKDVIQEKLFSFEGHIHIHEYGNNLFRAGTMPVPKDDRMQQAVAKERHVSHIAPYIKRAGILQTDGKMEGLMLKGIPEEFYFSKAIDFKGKKINYGDTVYSKDIILSQTTADRMNLKVGDAAQLYFLEEGSTFPRIRKVRIAGVFHTGMEDVDRAYGLCDIRLLQHINNWTPDEVSGYQVTLDDSRYDAEIADKILNDHLASPLYSYTMRETYSHVFAWLRLMDVNSGIILSIMAVVAIINLAVALLILMVEQARMIGVLKAQGMHMREMRRIFLFYALLIAGAGIVAGNILALGLGWIQVETGFIKLSEASYSMSTAPFKIVWWQVLATDVATLLLCIVFMLFPTLYLRRIQPARVLQFK